MDRRAFLASLGAGAQGLALAGCRRDRPPPEGRPTLFPEKAPDLIIHTDRPPNLEMPLRYLQHDLTPNEAMFVRWHLSGLPRTVDLRTFRLRVEGAVDRPLSLSFDELHALEAASVVAVNQCSGNSRAAFAPRVPGVQWQNGAVGNARFTGVRLRDLLARAGVQQSAKEVSFRGLDQPPRDSVAPFVKSLDLAKAGDPDVLVAYAMNGAPLPMLNGFPLRLVVPGFYSTYWVKALSEIRVERAPFDGYWMAKAYRIPEDARGDESPSALAEITVPISRLDVRSLIARPSADETLTVGKPIEVEGVAFDGGAGIRRVEVSVDDGTSWREARLDGDLGRYSWRRWRLSFTPAAAGTYAILARATSASGEGQRESPGWNRAGYLRNVYERVEARVR